MALKDIALSSGRYDSISSCYTMATVDVEPVSAVVLVRLPPLSHRMFFALLELMRTWLIHRSGINPSCGHWILVINGDCVF